jgi:hypothetical protein
MIIFELVGQFFFQNDIFKFQKGFSELGNRVILENGIRSFYRYFTDLRQIIGAKKFPKTVLKTKFKTKETTYILVFAKYPVVSIRSH